MLLRMFFLLLPKHSPAGEGVAVPKVEAPVTLSLGWGLLTPSHTSWLPTARVPIPGPQLPLGTLPAALRNDRRWCTGPVPGGGAPPLRQCSMQRTFTGGLKGLRLPPTWTPRKQQPRCTWAPRPQM